MMVHVYIYFYLDVHYDLCTYTFAMQFIVHVCACTFVSSHYLTVSSAISSLFRSRQ